MSVAKKCSNIANGSPISFKIKTIPDKLKANKTKRMAMKLVADWGEE